MFTFEEIIASCQYFNLIIKSLESIDVANLLMTCKAANPEYDKYDNRWLLVYEHRWHCVRFYVLFSKYIKLHYPWLLGYNYRRGWRGEWGLENGWSMHMGEEEESGIYYFNIQNADQKRVVSFTQEVDDDYERKLNYNKIEKVYLEKDNPYGWNYEYFDNTKLKELFSWDFTQFFGRFWKLKTYKRFLSRLEKRERKKRIQKYIVFLHRNFISLYNAINNNTYPRDMAKRIDHVKIHVLECLRKSGAILKRLLDAYFDNRFAEISKRDIVPLLENTDLENTYEIGLLFT
jgi:hypothetical protein